MNRADKMLALLDDGKNWTKFTTYNPKTNKYCLIGANAYCDDINESTKTDKIMRDLISKEYYDRMPMPGIMSISAFNDHHDTNWDDIRTILEKVSTKLDEVV